MSPYELQTVRKYYGLSRSLSDEQTPNAVLIKSDIEKNWDRLDALSTSMFYWVLTEAFEKLWAQKISVSILLSPLLVTLIPSAWITALPVLITIAIWIICLAATFIGQLLIRLGIQLHDSLEKKYTPQPIVKWGSGRNGAKIEYDVNLRENPGDKIYNSLSYSENLFLMFHQYRIDEDTRGHGCNLFNKKNEVIKSWDVHGDVCP